MLSFLNVELQANFFTLLLHFHQKAFQKTKIMASGPITSWQIDGETVETVSDSIFLSSKITEDGAAAMKLKDAYSLEEKL